LRPEAVEVQLYKKVQFDLLTSKSIRLSSMDGFSLLELLGIRMNILPVISKSYLPLSLCVVVAANDLNKMALPELLN
jgi:hypothetical protein